LPARSTIEKMIPADDVARIWSNPDAKEWKKLDWMPQWRYRATCPYLEPNVYPWFRNDLILKQTSALFGDVPRHDLDLFIAQSQSAQAEAIKFQVELFRSQKFTKKGGFVVWNLRDGWPTISDAVCDSFGTKKKSYFALKTAYRDVLPIVTEDRRLVIVNDLLAPAKGHVKLTEARTGKVVLELDYEAAPNAVTDLAPVAWDGQGLFIIGYTANGEMFRTHYLHGEPPFKWSDYAEWTKEL
jgi:beta-mannosidase